MKAEMSAFNIPPRCTKANTQSRCHFFLNGCAEIAKKWLHAVIVKYISTQMTLINKINAN